MVAEVSFPHIEESSMGDEYASESFSAKDIRCNSFYYAALRHVDFLVRPGDSTGSAASASGTSDLFFLHWVWHLVFKLHSYKQWHHSCVSSRPLSPTR